MNMSDENTDFKWRWNPPSLRTVKQPETLTPDEFLDMVERVDNEGVDPLIGLRNQCMLLTTYFSCYQNSSSHAGRHSFARFAQRLLEKKNNPDTSRIIQTLLHHNTEEAQRDYTDVDFNHIRQVAQKMMPKPKKRGRPLKND